MEVPPGWRDDDLIELYTFSQRIVEEGPVLYFAGASGHEPLFHTLRAPLIALAGINQASARWLSATAGTLVVVLTWAVGRRIVGLRAAPVAASMVAVSFWSLMYSRLAIRHVGTLPWALLAIYWSWRLLRGRTSPRMAVAGIAIGASGAVLTYYAGRLVPVMLALTYPVIESRRQRWRPYVVAIALGVALALPMFWSAARITGADARVSELAVPIHALLEGDSRPLIQTAWTTLGMAHAKGDPEWLYNRSERPVFGPGGAALFYVGLAVTLWRWRHPQSRLLLLWLAVGISPAFVSLPPSSYGHTILALPAVYLILASLQERIRALLRPRVAWLGVLAAIAIVAVVAVRDIPAYFVEWTRASMVGFLYRADYRNLADYLDRRSDIKDLVVGSMLFGPWDKVSVRTDLRRQDVRVRWANPERALVFASGEPTLTFVQDEGQRAPAIQALLEGSRLAPAPVGLQGYQVEPAPAPVTAVRATVDGTPLQQITFSNALTLQAVHLLSQIDAEAPMAVATWWRVDRPLPMPLEVLIPYPPEPGEYSGPRLSVFAHLSDTSGLLGIDDGLWVDPYTVFPGDVIMQIHVFAVSWTDNAPLELTLGLYDPLTGERWLTATGSDSVSVILVP
ncbi:MAG: glycosyltransferase family 39 protein [Anaerolineae bacterium]|nr:glycosyltransferase family 39 protein [Anaerolineae bacterium]